MLANALVRAQQDAARRMLAQFNGLDAANDDCCCGNWKSGDCAHDDAGWPAPTSLL